MGMEKRRTPALLAAACCFLWAREVRATLISSHVFSNHKGGCGKTTILFHASCEYALRNKAERVLVIDTTLRGDLSELLLGGDKGAAGKQAVRAVGHLRSTSKLLMHAAAEQAASRGDEGQRNSLVGLLFKGSGSKPSAAQGLDLDDQVIHVHDFNPAVPENLYLVPGGTGPQTSYPAHLRREIAATLRESLDRSAHAWKVLCDTDGDQGFSDYTKIAHALCDSCIIPLKTNGTEA
jgi:cellulose biosynthesis protein BcsQ